MKLTMAVGICLFALGFHNPMFFWSMSAFGLGGGAACIISIHKKLDAELDAVNKATENLLIGLIQEEARGK